MERKVETYWENGAEIPDQLIEGLLRKARSRLLPALNRIRRPVARVAAIDFEHRPPFGRTEHPRPARAALYGFR